MTAAAPALHRSDSMKTRSGLRLGISLPQSLPEGRVDQGYLRSYARHAESLGFDDGWLTESILSPHFQLEPVSYLSYIAAVTDRMRLGVAVIILNTRNPVQLAKSLATVDQLSNGRLTLGVGMGASTSNYAAFGISAERRVARFEEALRVLKALWSEERADLAGDFWRLEGARMQPKPLQKPHIPILLGGHSEPALRRAVRVGDGWMAAGSIPTEPCIESLKQIRGYLREAGRDESGFLLSKRLYLAIDQNETLARQKLSAALAYQYGGRDTATMGLAGTPSRVVEVLGKLREAGAQHVVLNPVCDQMQQMEALAATVVPQL
jgi:probable F420-dependent oxidoreductase